MAKLTYLGGIPKIKKSCDVKVDAYVKEIWITVPGLIGNVIKIPYDTLSDVQLQTEEQISKDVTLTRLLLVGVLAFGIKKKSKTINYCLVIEYDVEGIHLKAIFSGENCNKVFGNITNLRMAYNKKQSKNTAEKVAESTPITEVSRADEIAQFHTLLEQGIITQDEFDAKKKQLLGL